MKSLAEFRSFDLKKMKQTPGKYIKEMEAIDTVCEVLLSKAILEKTPLEKTFGESLGKNYCRGVAQTKGLAEADHPTGYRVYRKSRPVRPGD